MHSYINFAGYLVCGLTLFLYGVHITSVNLRKSVGNNFRILLQLVTNNRYLGVVIGVFITLLMQSSSATTVMLVSFVNARLMTFAQTLPITLGAGIGTTLTIQLVAFKITRISPFIIFIGFLVYILAKYKRTRAIGRVILGFGFIFFGMQLMSDGILPLKENQSFINALVKFSENPLLGLTVATVFTGIIQSSAATIALAMALAVKGMFGSDIDLILYAAIPIVLGANIGTCVTALLSSISGSIHAKRVAVAHIAYRIVGTVIILPFLSQVVFFVKMFSFEGADAAHLIANTHTFFNVFITGAFLFITKPTAKFIIWIFKEPSLSKSRFIIKKLNRSFLDKPEIAMRYSITEAHRILKPMESMFEFMYELHSSMNMKYIDLCKLEDNYIDFLTKRIIFYISGIKGFDIKKDKELVRFIFLMRNLERIGDVMSKDISENYEKLITKNLEFTVEAYLEIKTVFEHLKNNYLQFIREEFSPYFKTETPLYEISNTTIKEKIKLGDYYVSYPLPNVCSIHQSGIHNVFGNRLNCRVNKNNCHKRIRSHHIYCFSSKRCYKKLVEYSIRSIRKQISPHHYVDYYRSNSWDKPQSTKYKPKFFWDVSG